jgi:hypothetical protein
MELSSFQSFQTPFLSIIYSAFRSLVIRLIERETDNYTAANLCTCCSCAFEWLKNHRELSTFVVVVSQQPLEAFAFPAY